MGPRRICPRGPDQGPLHQRMELRGTRRGHQRHGRGTGHQGQPAVQLLVLRDRHEQQGGGRLRVRVQGVRRHRLQPHHLPHGQAQRAGPDDLGDLPELVFDPLGGNRYLRGNGLRPLRLSDTVQLRHPGHLLPHRRPQLRRDHPCRGRARLVVDLGLQRPAEGDFDLHVHRVGLGLRLLRGLRRRVRARGAYPNHRQLEQRPVHQRHRPVRWPEAAGLGRDRVRGGSPGQRRLGIESGLRDQGRRQQLPAGAVRLDYRLRT